MEGISELLKLYVDPHMTDLSGSTTLHDAISRDNKTSVSKLLESIVDIDGKKEGKIISIHSQYILVLTLRGTFHMHKLMQSPQICSG